MLKPKVRIAVDAMGGDYAPQEVIKGIVAACREDDEIEAILVGPEPALKNEVIRLDGESLPIHYLHTEECLREGEPPALAFRQKRHASIIIATSLVKSGDADAVVSAGPTGGVVTSAMMLLGTMAGIERPALGGPFIGFSPNTVLVDNGGNIDCKPYHLLNFATIGVVYAKTVLGIVNPRVALLSIGAEEGKGNSLVKEAYPLLKESGLNFIGNVEGNDLVEGRAEVVVCDGYIGNILLKFCEGMGLATANWIRNRLEGQLPANQVEEVYTQLIRLTNMADEGGGAPLLGINGIAMVMHGRSRAPQFVSVTAQVKRLVQSGFVASLAQELDQTKGGNNDRQ